MAAPIDAMSCGVSSGRFGMTVEHVLAVVPVTDVHRGARWYAALDRRSGTDPDGNTIRFIGGFRVQY